MNTLPRFSSSGDVFDWLARFINIDRGESTRSFRLDRSETLAKLAGHPESCAPVIHVAGSKGKGSVAGMMTAMLEDWGLKTARYTSPHITEYRERITLGNDFLDEAVYTAAGEELRGLLASLEDPRTEGHGLFNPQTEEGEEPAFFEALTLYFFLCARRAKCDIMVVETGLGGRLDATNIVNPLVSVITTIELEHMEFLGDTIQAIAAEKAGIIKPGRPLILMEQIPGALEIFQQTAAHKKAPLRYFPAVAGIEALRFDRKGTRFTLRFKEAGLFPEALDICLPVPGAIQAKNAGLAALALKTAFPALSAETVQRGLGTFTLPARFETIQDAPPVIIDGAHTPYSIECCTETFTALYGTGGVLLFGCAFRKDAQAMANTLVPHFSRIIITTPGTFKTSYPEQVYELFQAISRSAPGHEVRFIKDTSSAVREALRLAGEQGLPVLGTGSFYLAAEIRNMVKEARGVLCR